VFQLLEEEEAAADHSESTRQKQKVSGSIIIYPWSGKNKFFMLCRHDSISVGGGSHFAIFLQESLRKGSSGESDTFDSPILSATRDFRLAKLELWGISRCSPAAAICAEKGLFNT